MTNEEIEKQAEKYTNSINTLIYDIEDNAINIALKLRQSFKDGAKWGIANAIEWHDLRENPNDLPKEDCETVTLHENGNKNIIKWKHGEWTNAIIIPVIAWCELPQFKE